jgi:signal transduction histidine kinase
MIDQSLEKIFENNDEMVFVFNVDGNFEQAFSTDSNDLIANTSELEGLHFSEFLPVEISTKVETIFSDLRNGKRNDELLYSLNIGQEIKHFRARIWPVYNDKHPDRILASVRNITFEHDVISKLQRKEGMLNAISHTLQDLVENKNIIEAISNGLEMLGLATGVDRVYLFQNSFNEEIGENVTSQRYEWNSGGSVPQIDNPDLQNVPFSAISDFIDRMEGNKVFSSLIKDIPDGYFKEALEAQDIVSIIIVPIYSDEEFWGFVGFDDCHTEKIWSEVEINLLRSFSGSIASALSRKRIEEDLIRAKDIAEKASLAKSEFMANLSHEIRTPLNGVIGYTQLMREKTLDKEAQLFINNLSISTEILFELINDLLDFSKIESGKVELRPETVNLSDLLDELHSVLDFTVAKNSNVFTSHLDKNCPSSIYVDCLRLKQILINLISNAGKFMSDGTVVLNINPLNDGLYFEVKDSGIGIREEDFNKLFKPFSQVDSSLSKKYAGTGLGLSIVKRLLNAMNTEPQVESELGIGSTFSFVLPWSVIDIHQSGEPTSGRVDEFKKELIGKSNILVIDDNEINMMLVTHMLDRINPEIEVIECLSGKDAIEMLQKIEMPGLILLDIEMPGMDGFELFSELNSKFSNLSPVIALTASAHESLKQKCFEIGMSDFISKPCRLEDISSTISKYL